MLLIFVFRYVFYWVNLFKVYVLGNYLILVMVVEGKEVILLIEWLGEYFFRVFI